ncbi:MAG TPA: DinB family protein [Tepidisphaeraceae bacterium]|nr:DinB family protein [Tepidisphaeraceae bacterium]
MNFDLDRSAAVLRRTPAALTALLAGLDDAWTRATYGDGTFSPFDVVGHLLHAERANWLPRLRIILNDGEARPFDPFDRYAMFEASRGKTIDDLLGEFAAERARSLDALAALRLTPTDLARRGTHPQLGPLTASQILSAWVVHDLGHTHQVAKAMAYQYRDAVGPIRQFLTILPPT